MRTQLYKCLNWNKSTVIVVVAKSKFHAVRLIGLHYAKEDNEFESFESLLNSWGIIEINTDKEEFENRWFPNKYQLKKLKIKHIFLMGETKL